MVAADGAHGADAVDNETMRILPEIQCEDQYSALYEDDAIWQPAVRAIAARHGLAGEPERLTLGTHVVYGIEEVILKIYCPLWAESFEVERIALESVDNLPTPTVLSHGKIDGWPYLLQSRVMGVPAQSVWRTFYSPSAKTVPGSSPESSTLAMPASVIHSTTSSPY